VSRVRFLFDEDFNGHIVRGFRRRQPRADTRTVREAGLEGVDDPIVLKRVNLQTRAGSTSEETGADKLTDEIARR
jgi:hypothetical protein